MLSILFKKKKNHEGGIKNIPRSWVQHIQDYLKTSTYQHEIYVCVLIHLIFEFKKKRYDSKHTLLCCSMWSYEMLQDNVEGYRREITSLHERTQKLSATTQKQEQIINTMTQDLRGANEKLAVAEVSNTMDYASHIPSLCQNFS